MLLLEGGKVMETEAETRWERPQFFQQENRQEKEKAREREGRRRSGYEIKFYQMLAMRY